MALVLASAIWLASIYFQFCRRSPLTALLLLTTSGVVLRLLMAFVDPFLQDWDERFHALVAKNMMDYPFRPMLRVDPIMPYKVDDWCCNHIWVHKQPLFMWQMALAMKLFGVNEAVIRIPSVIMGSISIYFIYDIARRWINNLDVAFVAALLFTVSYYQLELTSGWFSLDQNDVAFSFYVTATIWAFVRYLNSAHMYRWAVTIGLFAGCAVLNKWLTGILIFGGWGLYELLCSKERLDINRWKPLILSIFSSLLVFGPWQAYILHNFPEESSLMFIHNRRHIFEVIEDHYGSMWFHFNQMRTTYGQYLLLFLPLGAYAVYADRLINKKLSIALLSMVVVIYSFFSFIVQTKMPAFTYPVNAILWILIATGAIFGSRILPIAYRVPFLTVGVALLSIYTLKPWQITSQRSDDNQARNAKIANTQIYKSLDLHGELKDRVIFNCKTFEDVELMFHQDVNAYHWYPSEPTIDSLLHNGHKLAAFKNHNNQHLPEYIYNNKDIVIIDESIQ